MHPVPVNGFMYPDEVELQWSILIVLYPYLTGLVAGAFILASLERVFKVEAVKPTYRLALLTALAFLLVAPLPLQLHLGHPERSFEMYLTPHRTSAMAMFGFVYLWYLMVVLLVEIWLDFRRDIVILSQTTQGWKRWIYRALTLGSSNISERALRIDERVGYVITMIGIPSAFLLHGYVGFIFGSVKANPWWSSPLMPVVFLFSAMVSGIAAVMLLYQFTSSVREQAGGHAVPGYDRALLAVYLPHRFQPGDAGSDAAHLRSRRVLPQPGFHGPHAIVDVAGGDPDAAGNGRADRDPGGDPGVQAAGDGAPEVVCAGRRADTGRDFRHALERGDRRATVFEKFSRLYQLQNGVCHAGGTAGRDPADASSVGHSLGAGQAAAAVVRAAVV